MGMRPSPIQETTVRPLRSRRSLHMAAVVAALITGCKDAGNITGPAKPLRVVNAANVEQLYVAVNDPGNAGATVLLAAGRYVLSVNDAAGVARPNGGRVELQQDMWLSGVDNDRTAVTIDATALTVASFKMSFGRTGVIRIGRGNNAVEWLTIAGNPLAAASIETDLGSSADAWSRVAHVTAGNSSRGVDVRNVGPANVGRRLQAEIEDDAFFRGAEGIRVANFVDATGGRISVVMHGNRAYENILGCILENNRSDSTAIHVVSSGDRFEDNGLGCDIGGALSLSSGAANSDSTIFEAQGTDFTNNTRTTFFNTTGPVFTEYGGVRVIGGNAAPPSASTSRNSVIVRLTDCRVAGNQHIDLQAFGGLTTDASANPGSPKADLSLIPGTANHATIELYRVSKQIAVVGAASSPVDPSGSNTLTVLR